MKPKRPFLTLSSVQEQPVNWLLKPYLARASLSILEGHPGQGKSTFVAGLVAAITSEKHLPFGEGLVRGRVLLFSAEDDASRVLRPRLEANGADLAKIRIQNENELFTLGKKGLDLLRHELALHTPVLVVIDPLISYLGRAEMNDAQDMTEFLGGIEALAREFNVAILGIRHHRKSESDHSLHRGMGSIAISGRARSVLSLGRHPGDPSVRAVAHPKCSWAKEGETILFAITNARGKSVVKWLGTTDELDADQLLARPAGKTGPTGELRDQAKRFLEAELRDGPKRQAQLAAHAERKSIAWMTIRRASEELRIVKKKTGGISIWSLPKG